jgi:hypothetical protein
MRILIGVTGLAAGSVLLGARDQIRLAREQLLDLAVDRFRAIEIMPIQKKESTMLPQAIVAFA